MGDEKETIDQSGIIPGVEKSLFTPELDDEVQDGGEENQAGAEVQEDAVQTETIQQPGSQEIEPEKGGAQPVAQPAGQAPRVYADKFKTEEELKHAFVNLGGNPNRYDTIEKLEEAYEVRQAEFSRARGELATQERLNKNIQQPTPSQKGNPLDPEALLDKVQWDKVENARDLGRELISLMTQIMPQNEPNLPSEAELVDKIMPIMQEREARIHELQAVEKDIPRLALIPGQENPFREAFARHVFGEKQAGTYVSLKKSMTNFLNWGKSIAEEAGRQTEIQKGAKLDAAPNADGGSGLPAGGEVDETDAIITSFKKVKERRGEL